MGGVEVSPLQVLELRQLVTEQGRRLGRLERAVAGMARKEK